MRHRLAHLLLSAAGGLIGLLPLSWARRLGRLGGAVYHRFGGQRSQMARRHMQRLGRAEASAPRLVFEHYGRRWAESLWVRPTRVDELEEGTASEGLEHLAKAKAQGKGVILALPHQGFFELAAPIAAHLGLRVVAVAEALDNRLLRAWFTRMRATFGIGIVYADSPGLMRELVELMTPDTAIALLADRDLTGRGVKVEFCGETTTLPGGPAALSIRTGAPIVPISMYFTPAGSLLVVTEALTAPAEGANSERVEAITRLLAGRLEELIRRDPPQWHVLQPIWPSDLA